MLSRSLSQTVPALFVKTVLVGALAALAVPAMAQPPERAGNAGTTILHCGKLIDVRAGEVLGPHALVVEDGKISALRKGTGKNLENPGATVIDLERQTCMPGLMDMHTHLSNQNGPDSYSERFRLDPGDYAFRMVTYAERTLMAGFTTVRDLGDVARLSVPLKNAIGAGWVVGPRIFTASKGIGTTGGHADPTNGVRADLREDPGPKEGVVNSIGDARKAVRQRYKDGADLIKITATGGVLSVARNGQNPQFSEEVIRAIVETARDYDFIVAAHAHGAEGMKRAIRAGVTSIEHGTLMDDEVIALMKEHGTYYVPTISAGRWVAEKAEIDGFFPEVVRGKAAELGPKIQETTRRAHEAGVKIAFGTDSGVSPHGENGKEFLYMAEAGIPILEAIRSATLTAAEMLRIDDRLGTLEAGKIADVVAVTGDPTEDVEAMLSVVFVMKEGEVFKRP